MEQNEPNKPQAPLSGRWAHLWLLPFSRCQHNAKEEQGKNIDRLVGRSVGVGLPEWIAPFLARPG